MFKDPTFWVAVAFVIFLLIAFFFKVHKALLAALDGRIERVRHELDEAQSLREEAQKTLAESKRKQRDALSEAEKIIEHAKEEAGRLRQTAEQDLEQSLARRAQQAEEKIAQAEATALKEVRDRAIDVALAATARLLQDKVDDSRAESIIDDSISELSSKLN
jgi:F-type H+-transporting ATPase subunit b